MAKDNEVLLGDEAEDSISGYSGIVVAITAWLYGCRRVVLQPTDLDKDGKPKEGLPFDELQVIVTKKSRVEPVTVQTERAVVSKTGGPRPEFPRR